MSWWFKFKAWLKLGTFGLLSLFLLVFTWNNINKPVKLWLWHDIDTTLINVVLMTMLVSVVGTLLLRTTWVTLRQLRQSRQRALTEQNEALRVKAAQLQTRPLASSAPPREQP